MRQTAFFAAIGILALQVALERRAHAWLFVEHTEIGRTALSDGSQPLSTAQRNVLAQAWASVVDLGRREGVPVCDVIGMPSSPIESKTHAGDTVFNTCIDLPMLAALAGDHSCNAQDLATTIRSVWVQPLIRAFAENYELIRNTDQGSPQRVSLWHAGHLEAQRIDAAYLSRAQQSGAHFVLPRRVSGRYGETAEDLRAYARRVSALGAPINTVGLYIAYHAQAVQAAGEAHCSSGGPCMRPETARSALFYEAVALHFLEDAFSSGHVVGGPEDTAKASRMGTHDYYCTKGLSTCTWDGFSYSAYGDAHLRELDRWRTAAAVRQSLAQLADALSGALGDRVNACAQVATPDVCTSETLPQTNADCTDLMTQTLALMPAPPLAATPEPSVRNDVGAFLRFGLSADLGAGWPSSVAAPYPLCDPRSKAS